MHRGAPDLSAQAADVLQVVQEYTRAFERLDVKTAKALRPSLDDERLQRAFHDLRGQQFRNVSCGVESISGEAANARCRGDATYRPKVGNRLQRMAQEWTFTLSRSDDRWQIVNATLQ